MDMLGVIPPGKKKVAAWQGLGGVGQSPTSMLCIQASDKLQEETKV